MRLNRLIVAWAGPSVVGTAVNVLHFEGAEGAVPDVAAVLSAYGLLAGLLPAGVTCTIPNGGDVIEDTTGELVDVWTSTGGGTVTGTGLAGAAAGVGACITWLTGGIVNGRRLRGRTFIVPLNASLYEGDGTLNTPALTGLNAWAAAMRASGGLAVWHRPTTATSTDGNSYGVLSSRLRDKVAFLSSRRD